MTLLTRNVRTTAIRAIEDIEVIEIAKERFTEIIAKDAEILNKLVKTLENINLLLLKLSKKKRRTQIS